MTEDLIEAKSSAVDKLRIYMYYFIIGIISFVALVFLPMVGTQVGLGWDIPNTTVGWIVWFTVKLIVAIINIMIFHSFMCQAKINVRDDPKYQEAQEILRRIKVKNYIPRSPKKWNGQQYGKKGTMIFITSALAVVALTQALLTFDWMSMLSYLFTIIMGLIFGVMQMKTAEEYWTDEFWKYAKMVKEENEREEELKREAENSLAMTEERSSEQADDCVSDICGTDILESSNTVCDTGDSDKSLVMDYCWVDNSILGASVSIACNTDSDSDSLRAEETSTIHKKEEK